MRCRNSLKLLKLTQNNLKLRPLSKLLTGVFFYDNIYLDRYIRNTTSNSRRTAHYGLRRYLAMSERMTCKEREEKFLPVIQKLLAATEANGAFLKAKDKNVAADELQRLEETKNSAKQSATSIQSGSGVI